MYSTKTEAVLERLKEDSSPLSLSAASVIEELLVALGSKRMCVNCGKVRDASIPTTEPGCNPDEEYGFLCMFDATPQEAWLYWRDKYHKEINGRT